MVEELHREREKLEQRTRESKKQAEVKIALQEEAF